MESRQFTARVPASAVINVPVAIEMESAAKSNTSPCLELKKRSWQTSVRHANISPLTNVIAMACFFMNGVSVAYLHDSHVMNGYGKNMAKWAYLSSRMPRKYPPRFSPVDENL